ncbi:MAG: zinc metalloprotease [Planctomycetota bacterium]|jgi:hypothetical protein
MKLKYAIIILAAVTGLTITSSGCGGGGGSSSRGAPPSYGGGGGTVFGAYVNGTDKWHIAFDDSALVTALNTVALPADNAGAVKQKTIQYIQQYYSGLAISFCTEPLEDGSTPAPGAEVKVDQLGPKPFNTIAVRNVGATSGLTGQAYQDLYDNEMIENDSSVSDVLGGQLGVFLDVYSHIFSSSVDVDNFAKFLAAIIAHEIGHSLGLVHNENGINIMNAKGCIDYAVTPSFAAEDISRLQNLLPGPGRD